MNLSARMTVSLALIMLAGCTTDPGPAAVSTPPPGPPQAPADMCADLGPELLARLVPDGQQTVEPGAVYGDYTSAACGLITKVAPQRDLGVIINRHNPPEACASALDGKIEAGLDLFAKPSARQITMKVGDESEARIEKPAGTNPLMAVQVGLCRSGDLFMVQYRADGLSEKAVTAAVEEVAKRVMELYPR